ncbi:MAG: PQQ-binding-like beta-propeller repeat protein [Bacteriovoracaceae bacterium]|nr:PQQ-like beta-propeller repeat protein [Bacteroidota bacterium]
MSKAVHVIVTLVLFGIFNGCDNDGGPENDNGIPDQTNGRITIINDEAKLNERLTLLNDTIIVENGNFSKTSNPSAVKLVLEAQVNPPTVNGQTLQATSVSLDGNFAYVSYNLRGESYAGAIDIIQIKGDNKATIRSEALFNDTKVSAVFFDASTSKVYLAEATSNASYSTPAVIEKISTNGSKLNLANPIRAGLSSYVTTSALVKSTAVYATTGNTGGLYKLTKDSLKEISYTPISDARWVDVDGNFIAVVQGGGKLAVYNAATGAFLNTYNFTGTSIPESKSTVQVIGGKALIAAGDGGVVLMNLATGKVVGSLPRRIVNGLDSSVTVTNAVAANGEYLYISNGEAGVYQAKANDQNLSSQTGDTDISLSIQGKLKFSALQSVNHVAFDGETLVIASGLGGVKIVKVK